MQLRDRKDGTCSAMNAIVFASMSDAWVPYFTSTVGEIFRSRVPAPTATVSDFDG